MFYFLFLATQVNLHVGATVYNVTTLQSSQTFNGVDVTYNTNPATNITKLVLSCPSGTALEVKIYPRLLMSTVSSAADPSDTVVGLLGNGNGDQSDDLKAKDGTVLALNSTEENIYYQFGQTCK